MEQNTQHPYPASRQVSAPIRMVHTTTSTVTPLEPECAVCSIQLPETSLLPNADVIEGHHAALMTT